MTSDRIIYPKGSSMRGALLAFVAVVSAGIIAIAYAQEVKPDRAIKYRQGALTTMAWHFGVLGAMAKGEVPYNKDEAIKRATIVAEISTLPWEGFTPGSDQGAPTKAKPEVWKDPAKFKERQDKLIQEAAKLETVAKSGDEAALKAQVGATGKACGNCHDDFRAK
jgi:cytochrome c556